MIRLPLSCLLTVGLMLALTASSFAAPPEVKSLFPAGTQRGTTVTVEVSPAWDIKTPVEIWCSQPSVKITPDEKKPQLNIEVPADVPPGICWIRLLNADGVSALRPFLIGTLPGHTETEPNNSIQLANVLKGSRHDVHGKFAASGDVDVFAVNLKAGETVVASMTANETLGSPLDGILQLVSPDGFVLKQIDDNPALDPELTFTARTAGTYFVRTFCFTATPATAIRFAGGADYVYRLTITTGPFVDYVVPGWVKTGTSEADQPVYQLRGWNLPAEKMTVSPGATHPDGSRDVFHPDWANTLILPPAETDSLGEAAVRAAGEKPLTLPAQITGTLSEPGEIDRYTFQGQKGPARIEVQGRKPGLSTDPVIRLLREDGTLIKELDDTVRAQFDALLVQRIADEKLYHVEIRDLHQRGGERFAYHLSISFPEPSVKLTVTKDRWELTPDKPLEIPVTIIRDRITDPLEITATDLPKGVTATAVISEPTGATAKAVKLKLTADKAIDFSQPVRSQFQIIATPKPATEAENAAEEPAKEAAPVSATAPLEVLSLRTSDLWLTVQKPAEAEKK